MGLRVVGAGVGRTGTASLTLALKRLLGAPCYHGYELALHPHHMRLWHEAVRGNEVDWNDIYGGYAATVDWPGAAFWRSLHQTYPESLVLLSVRDTDAWFRSANATIIDLTRRMGNQEVATWTPEMKAWHSMHWELFATRFAPVPWDEHTAKRAYERHNSEVRATVPANRLLEWHPGDGWEPLCERLGAPVPEEPFPHINMTDDWRAAMALPPRSWRRRVGRLLRRLSPA